MQPLKVYSEIITNDAPIQHFSTQFCIVLVFRYSQKYKTVSTVTTVLSTAASLLPNSKTFYKLLPEAIISRFARFFQNLARIKISTLKLLQELCQWLININSWFILFLKISLFDCNLNLLFQRCNSPTHHLVHAHN